MAIMVDRLDQVKPLTAALYARRDATTGFPPFGKIISIYDLVPDEQAEKLPLLREMRARIDRIRELGKISDDDWKAMEPYRPPKDLATFTLADLPERVARPFTESDGTRGRIVYITPTEGSSVRDVKYLRRWADAYRRTVLPSGEVIVGSGRAVIFADMLEGVIEESPKAIVLSFIGTVVVVILSFAGARGGLRATLLVLGSLLVGLAWMGGTMAVLGVRLNFLNFIAFPITVGIGVDYAINVVHRWRVEGPGQLPRIVRETGGAVVLCSLTTTLGYLALLRSVNMAVRSFGLAAVIGEIACLLAVMVVLPACLKWLEQREQTA
jgi:predicted RND superfamily exporter protein